MSIFDRPAEYTKRLERQLEKKPYTEKDTCVCCGKYVPEGRQVCKECENSDKINNVQWQEV